MAKCKECTAFVNELDRERTRADRSRGLFSLVIYTVPTEAAEGRVVRQLSQAVGSRMRCYDSSGWLAEKSWGVLLPDTAYEDACRFADMLDTISGCSAGDLRREVFSYPEMRWELDAGSYLPSVQATHNRRSADIGILQADIEAFIMPEGNLVKKAIRSAAYGLRVLAPMILLLAVIFQFIDLGTTF
ncbi:MAG: hypothetical protein GY868_10110 [Deltaproteobacteria bacterium]|nr:hypothetical protein [Deltaproteobacteria bacterium]